MKAHHDQHFLTDPHAVDRIADLADVKGKRVLEVGPGNGALTRALLDRGAIVHAVELDGHLCEELTDRFSEEISTGQLTVQHGDATRCELPPFRDGCFKSPVFRFVQDHLPPSGYRVYRGSPDVPE